MAITKAQKVSLLQDLADNVVSQKSVVLLNTDGVKVNLTAQTNSDLRKKADEQGVRLKIVKNTLIRRSFPDLDIPEFTGQTFMAYSTSAPEETDEVSVAKAIVGIVKSDFKDNVNVFGAVVDGKFLDSVGAVTLSNTPTKQDSLATVAVMMSQLAGGKVATLVKEVTNKVARGVGEYSKTLS